MFILLIAGIVFLLWNLALNKPGIETTCVNINEAKNYIFDSCYSSKHQIIFLTFKRNSYDSFDITKFNVSFFDDSNKEKEINEVPQKGFSKTYQISAVKNPKNIYVDLNVNQDFKKEKCSQERRVFVKDCEDKSPLDTTNNPSKENIQTPLNLHLLELKIKEEMWKSKCQSNWNCSSWDICQAGIQKRICSDLSKCFIPTDSPQTVRYCSQNCIEDWACSWSSCTNGFTNPSCIDRNNCQTKNNIPHPVECNFDETCTPDITCTEWSQCVVNYDLLSLETKEAENLNGTRSRICSDKNSCTNSIKQISECSTAVDIYTRIYNKCNMEYIEVYNKLDNSLLARIESGKEKNPYLNIRLDSGSGQLYCDYCYNGVLDGDEIDVDCGGSCISCDKKRGPINLLSDSLFARIGRWFKNLF